MSAAGELKGLKLSNDWTVVEHLQRNPNGSGGTFSHSYQVEKDGKIGFLKAFDFAPAFDPGVDTIELMQILVGSYDHEKAVLEHCKTRRLSNVVMAIDAGFVQVPNLGAMEGRVYYLVFEMADGDVRCQIDISKRFDSLWCIRALKDVCLGLWQIHKEMIAHQDTKPSNVLVYKNAHFKVSDFGRSSRKGHPAWHDELPVAGDSSYAPPELLYGYTHADFNARRFGCDIYMLGNLATFLFCGANVTAQLLSKLNTQHHPRNWSGSYDDVLPYLTNAFTSVLHDLTQANPALPPEIIEIVGELCCPNIANRGHPRSIGKYDHFSLERYVSRFDVLLRKFTIRQATV